MCHRKLPTKIFCVYWTKFKNTLSFQATGLCWVFSWAGIGNVEDAIQGFFSPTQRRRDTRSQGICHPITNGQQGPDPLTQIIWPIESNKFLILTGPTKRSTGVELAEQADHSVGPLLSIHFPGNYSFKNCLTVTACGGTPSCWKVKFSSRYWLFSLTIPVIVESTTFWWYFQFISVITFSEFQIINKPNFKHLRVFGKII